MRCGALLTGGDREHVRRERSVGENDAGGNERFGAGPRLARYGPTRAGAIRQSAGRLAGRPTGPGRRRAGRRPGWSVRPGRRGPRGSRAAGRRYAGCTERIRAEHAAGQEPAGDGRARSPGRRSPGRPPWYGRCGGRRADGPAGQSRLFRSEEQGSHRTDGPGGAGEGGATRLARTADSGGGDRAAKHGIARSPGDDQRREGRRCHRRRRDEPDNGQAPRVPAPISKRATS